MRLHGLLRGRERVQGRERCIGAEHAPGDDREGGTIACADGVKTHRGVGDIVTKHKRVAIRRDQAHGVGGLLELQTSGAKIVFRPYLGRTTNEERVSRV